MTEEVLASFDSSVSCVNAIVALRKQGFVELSTHTPRYCPDIDAALDTPKSPLSKIVFAAGLTGACLGYAILWYTNAHDYVLDIGSRTHHAVPAFIPITFETMLLFAACSAFVFGLGLSGLPKLSHKHFTIPEFARVTIDRYFVAVVVPKARVEALLQLVDGLGALSVHRVLDDVAHNHVAHSGDKEGDS